MSLIGNLSKLLLPRSYATIVRDMQGYYAMKETFIADQYNWLLNNLNKKSIAVDIGANIGDSAIYFARNKNVKLVYAYEPFPILYKEAKKNISLAKSKKIKLFNAGICSSNKDIMIPDMYPAHEGSIIKNYNKGIKIHIYDINYILKNIRNLHTEQILIKSDCEGCEYNIFNETVNLSKVTKIQIEFHHGVNNIPSVLKQKKFRVATKGNIKSGIGWIYAVKGI